MAALSERKIEIVRTLVESAPDKIVGGLQRALAETGGDTLLASVRQLVEVEAADRMLRNAVFQPVTPLFVGDGSDTRSLVFPARALASIWRGLKALEPDAVAAASKASAGVAKAIASGQRPVDPSDIFDALVEAAAKALRSSDLREFRIAAELCDRARPAAAESLAACMDIAPIVRRALPRLPDWVDQAGEQTGAAARLAYKDAVAIAEDAGPRFFEMLAGQLTPPWMILRIISAIMDKPTERYLADSELGGFPERVMNDIDESLQAISKLDLDGGPAAARGAARKVELITQQVFELEVCIELTRENGWGKRIVGQKKALASLVEGQLRDLEKLLGAALPSHSGGFSRPRKTGPNIEQAPDPKAVGRVMTMLTFAHEIRLCANYGGFSAMHTKMTEKLGDLIDHYVEDVLDLLRSGHVEDVTVAHAFLLVAADVSRLIRDDKAADLVRRRAATACTPPESPVTLPA